MRRVRHRRPYSIVQKSSLNGESTKQLTAEKQQRIIKTYRNTRKEHTACT